MIKSTNNHLKKDHVIKDVVVNIPYVSKVNKLYNLLNVSVHYCKECNLYFVFMNLDNNHKNATEKELYKIKHLLRVKLIPELDELDNKLKTNTVEDIIEDHPEMDKIIRKRKEISKELELWQKKIDLINMQNN